MANGDDRLAGLLRRYALLTAFTLGLLLISVGALAEGEIANVLYGLGTSIFASSAFTRIVLAREELAEELGQLGVTKLFANRRQELRDEFWERLIADTRYEFRVLGVANHGYLYSQAAKETYGQAFRSAIERGATVTLMWLDPLSQLASIRDREEGRAMRHDTVLSVEWFWTLKQELTPDSRARLRMLAHSDTPTCGITWADDTVVVTNYLAGALNLEAPGMVLTMKSTFSAVRRLLGRPGREGELARGYTRNLREVEARSREIEESDVRAFLAKAPEFRSGPSEAEVRQQRDEEEERDGD